MSNKRYLCQTVDPSIIADPDLKEEYDGLRRISQNWTYTSNNEYFEIDKALYAVLRKRYDLPEDPFLPSTPKEDKKGKKPKPEPKPKKEPEPDREDEDDEEELIDIKPGMWAEQSTEWLGEAVEVYEEEEYLIVRVGDKQERWPIDEDLQVFEEGWQPEPYFQRGDEAVLKNPSGKSGAFTVKAVEIHKSLDPDKDRYTLHGLPATVHSRQANT